MFEILQIILEIQECHRCCLKCNKFFYESRGNNMSTVASHYLWCGTRKGSSCRIHACPHEQQAVPLHFALDFCNVSIVVFLYQELTTNTKLKTRYSNSRPTFICNQTLDLFRFKSNTVEKVNLERMPIVTF